MKRRSLALSALTVAAGLSALTASTGAAAAGDAKAGEAIFNARCQMCHSAGPGRPAVLAPDLHKVGNRKAAATGFAYSEALKKSGLTWTSANLDKFLTSPFKLVPGTRMVISIPDATERANVVAYLMSLK